MINMRASLCLKSVLNDVVYKEGRGRGRGWGVKGNIFRTGNQ